MYTYIDKDLVEFRPRPFVDICHTAFASSFEAWMSSPSSAKMCNRSVHEECRCK